MDLVVSRGRQDIMGRIRWSQTGLYDVPHEVVLVPTDLDVVGVLIFEVLVGEGPLVMLQFLGNVEALEILEGLCF